jgi:hypothetical protein
MGIFLPPDISVRIKQFMAAKMDFPFLGKDELLAVFYLFGKDYEVIGESEVNAASDLAKRAVGKGYPGLYHHAPENGCTIYA